jgi:NADH:ubiquinone oxidoreductase subunit E
MSLEFSAEALKSLEAARLEHPEPRSVLITTLKLAQEEFGHLSNEVLAYVASELEIPGSIVAGVATFYHNLHTRPRGKHVISVCRTLSCELAGGLEVAARFKELLGIDFGETTGDGLITLVSAECLACCGTAPAVQVDYDYFEGFRPEQCEEIIGALREGRRPPGGSGVPGGWPDASEDAQ